MSQSFIRLSVVKSRTGLSRSTIYRRIAEGRFPVPVSLGGRSVGWLDSEIGDWMVQQILVRSLLQEPQGLSPTRRHQQAVKLAAGNTKTAKR